jgi:hypothetical protein
MGKLSSGRAAEFAGIKPIIKKLLEIDFRLKPNLIETIIELAGNEQELTETSNKQILFYPGSN